MERKEKTRLFALAKTGVRFPGWPVRVHEVAKAGSKGTSRQRFLFLGEEFVGFNTGNDWNRSSGISVTRPELKASEYDRLAPC